MMESAFGAVANYDPATLLKVGATIGVVFLGRAGATKIFIPTLLSTLWYVFL